MTTERCSSMVGRERMQHCVRPGTETQFGYTVCTVHAAALRRGAATRKANDERFKAESDARRDQYQQEQTARERRARKLAAFDDLLRVAEDLLRYVTTDEQTIGLPEIRAAITKAKEAQHG